MATTAVERGMPVVPPQLRGGEVSVLFSDLAGFTSFAGRSTPAEVATVLDTYYAMAAPLISRRFGGELEKFVGDGMMATFNSRGDGARAEAVTGVRVKGKEAPLDAYLLQALA